jgi:hypothetical protein
VNHDAWLKQRARTVMIPAMHLPAETVPLIGVALGGVIAAGSATLAQHWVRRDARAVRRREAYAALILTLDHLERSWTAPETLEDEAAEKRIGIITGQAIREIQRAYTVVLLVGSKQAKARANTARKSAWAINDCLHSGGNQGGVLKHLGTLFVAFSAAARAFVDAAEADCR